jgi:signal transduction histidine kinase
MGVKRRLHKLSIAQHILLLSLMPMLLLFIAIFLFLLSARLDDLEKIQRDRGELLAQQLSVASEFAVLTGNQPQLRDLLSRTAKDLVASIRIWDARNNLMAAVGHADSEPHADRFEAAIRLTTIDVDDALLGTDKSNERIESRQIGRVELFLSRASIIENRNQAIAISVVVGVPLLLLGIAIVWYFGQRLARPVAKLTDVTVALANGDLSVRAAEDGPGEIGVLQRSVNSMAASLEKSQQRLQENLTQLDQARAAAEQANRAKSEFLATMSHELRTPMNGALGMLELLKNTGLQSQQQHYVNVAIDSTQHLLTVVNDILDFSRIERGLLQLEPIYSDVGALMRQVLESFRIAAQQKHLNLDLHVDPTLDGVQLLIDPARLRQVVVNLIGNAIKFTFTGGITINVKASWRGDNAIYLEISISDTGIGIPADKQKLIFQAFRQADGSTMRRFGGSGLGLAIVQKICELMSASVDLQSAPNRGSCFTVRLEAPARRAANPVRALETLSPLLHGQVLVVEDNAVNLMVVANMLETLGITVCTAANGREALERLGRQRVDLVLMDCQMPEMDGYQATAQIRRHPDKAIAQLPIIALTANAMVEDRERCLAAGMSDYLSKPVTLQLLREKIARWLPRAR